MRKVFNLTEYLMTTRFPSGLVTGLSLVRLRYPEWRELSLFRAGGPGLEITPSILGVLNKLLLTFLK